jgi:uncharacterized protein YlxW (UPF0749 family)
METGMIFKNLSENPQESTLVLTILGLIFTQGLNVVETGVLGRIFIYLGEVVTTISILMAAKEAEEAVTNEKDMTVTSEDTITVDVDNIRKIINELQQQNQCLQDQIWALQEELSSIQKKS